MVEDLHGAFHRSLLYENRFMHVTKRLKDTVQDRP